MQITSTKANKKKRKCGTITPLSSHTKVINISEFSGEHEIGYCIERFLSFNVPSHPVWFFNLFKQCE